ncbi:Subtilisin-like protease SBT5.4 [Bienertia sinuspersici]
MSTPHVAGIAALLKKLHPHWTTAAIKSAIMTTASPLDIDERPILEDDLVSKATPFAYGAGLVQPNLAMDPGLVYDMNHYDYLNFLCAQHYNNSAVGVFANQHAYKCPSSFSLLDFNCPSITISDFSGTAMVTRKLKNVGPPNTYTSRIQAPPGISVVVEPKTLVYSKVDQEILFKLVFSTDNFNNLPMDYSFGSLVWSDGKHVVRSPIAVKAKKA